MKNIVKTISVIATMGASIAHAGIIADAFARHEARKATAAASKASAAGASTSAPVTGQVGGARQGGQAAAIIDYAQRTHAAAQGVVNHQLSNGEQCAELVHQGKLPTATLSQYKCILMGPKAALASVQRASGAIASK